MKRAQNPKNIDEYIAGFPLDVQSILEQIRAVVREVAPDAVEAMKYGIPTFVLQENIVHFAAFENHVGFYPTPAGIEKFKDDLSAYKHARGSVQFPIDQPMPLKLISRIVTFRVEEVMAKSFARNRKKS